MSHMSCSTRYAPLLISTAAKISIYFFNGVWHDIPSKEKEMARIRSNVIYVSLLCLSSRLCKWSKSTQGRGKVTQALPLAQPASALKLRQAVIINEETWANGQEMQRYWLGWLPCSKPYTGWRQLGGLWFPRLLYVGGGTAKVWNRATAGSCHIQATPEGRSTGDGTRTQKKKVWVNS